MWPQEIMLTFFAGMVAGVFVTEGLIKPRRQRRALIRRRLMGCYGLRDV